MEVNLDKGPEKMQTWARKWPSQIFHLLSVDVLPSYFIATATKYLSLNHTRRDFVNQSLNIFLLYLYNWYMIWSFAWFKSGW